MLVDKDLRSVQEVRTKVQAAHEAFQAFQGFSQEQVDAIVAAMAAAARANSESLARMAVEETGYGKRPRQDRQEPAQLRPAVPEDRAIEDHRGAGRGPCPGHHRDRSAGRGRRGRAAHDQPDIDGLLQVPDRGQGGQRDRHQPASAGPPLHVRGRAPARGSGRGGRRATGPHPVRRRGDHRRHQRADGAPADRDHPIDRRCGHCQGGLLQREASAGGGSRQRPGAHR